MRSIFFRQALFSQAEKNSEKIQTYSGKLINSFNLLPIFTLFSDIVTDSLILTENNWILGKSQEEGSPKKGALKKERGARVSHRLVYVFWCTWSRWMGSIDINLKNCPTFLGSFPLTENAFSEMFLPESFFRLSFFRGFYIRGPFFMGISFRGDLFLGTIFSKTFFPQTFFPHTK